MALEDAKRQQESKRLKSLHSEDPQSVPRLPPEITADILMRLPVESLLRCKSVCKSWCSLISDPHFIKSHLSLSSSNDQYAHHRLMITTMERTSLLSYPLYDVLHDKIGNPLNHGNSSQPFYGEPFLWIVGSCNGLICVCVRVDALLLWNPATRIWNGFCYGFRRCGWHVVYGFGYDESTNDYQVVGISHYVGSKPRFKTENRVKIYSLNTASWRKVGDFPHNHILNDSGKFINGALHWVSRGRSYPWTIVSIDLAYETYGEVSQPLYEEGNKVLTLGVLGDCLCVLCNYYDADYAYVWVMKVYGVKDSWSKLVSIPHLSDPGRNHFSMPLFISNDGKVLLRLWLRLAVYDSENSSSSKIQIYYNCFQAITFVESLVSPGSNIRWNLRKRRIP